MKNAIILHGRASKDSYYSVDTPSSSNFAWIPWLQKQLIIEDIKTDTPEVPHSYKANFEVWRKEFERFDVNHETILIGHSAGGGFLLRWLSENKTVKAAKVILVAPGFSLLESSLDSIDSLLAERVKNIVVFVSKDDSVSILENVERLKTRYSDLKVVEFDNYGHFIPKHMGKVEFPKLLEEVMRERL